FDMESMRQVSQTMHAYIDEVMTSADTNEVDCLSISQYSPSGHAFRLENCRRGVTNYIYRQQLTDELFESKEPAGAGCWRLYECRHIYTGAQGNSKYSTVLDRGESKAPDPIFFTRLKLALHRQSFKKLRLINLNVNLLSKYIPMLMGSSFQAIHIGLPLIVYSVHRRIMTKILLDVCCQEMIIEGFQEVVLDKNKDTPLFNELFVQNFVNTGHRNYCIRVKHRKYELWDPIVVIPSRKIAFDVLPRFKNFDIKTW
ncbi:hypothetical protein PFISCL1PPCAC_18213, partial [Pristionchus fissidentatus]